MYNEREREGERDTKQLVKEGRKASQNRTEHWNSFLRFLINTAMGDRTYVRESMKEKRMLFEPARK